MYGKNKKSMKKNPWMVHVAKVKKNNKKVPFKDVLKLAKKSYKKK